MGIAADKLEAIFNPFVQADSSVTRQFGGTGLGLTISRRIARALGGNVSVSSEVGKGSTFTVTIATGPLDDVKILAAAEGDCVQSVQHQHGSLPSLAGARVLLVEDGDSNRKLASLVLRRVGAQVTMATNGKIAVDLATENPFDLILMDIQMPVMDGYVATKLLRQQGMTMPIIALTAHAMKGDEDKCRAAGCSGYITKPIDGDRLVRTVAEVLRDASGGNGSGSAGDAAMEPDTAAPSLDRAGRVAPPTAEAAPAEGVLFSTLPTEDPDFREIAEDFVERLDDKLDAMQQAIREHDLVEVTNLAHWVRGAGATAGFPAFTLPAKRLEALARGQQYDEIEATVEELLDLAQRIAVRPEEPAAVRAPGTGP